MKKSTILFASIALISFSALASCDAPKSSDNEDMREIKTEVVETKNEISDEVWEAYKREIQGKIDANKDKIAALREAKSDTKSNVTKEEYKQQIDDLQDRNQKLREKLADYPLHRTDWEQFKADVNKEAGAIGQALDNL